MVEHVYLCSLWSRISAKTVPKLPNYDYTSVQLLLIYYME